MSVPTIGKGGAVSATSGGLVWTAATLLGLAACLPVAGQSPPPVARPVDMEEAQGRALLEQVNRAWAGLTESVVPSVVSIDTTTTVRVRRYVPVDPFGFFGYHSRGEERGAPGLGSGVIVSTTGHVVTNHHVVAGVDEIEITTHEGERFKASWVGSDPDLDIAVLQIEAPEGKTFPALPFGDSDAVRVGEMVLAVGNPYGLSETVTRGIVSAKRRRLSDDTNEYFQTDTAINPGSSGGPLINVRGEIVGINVALLSGQQEVKVWQGLGLSVPSKQVQEVYEAVVLDRPLLRGYLGIALGDLDPYLARQIGLSSTRGAMITDVERDSPAARAGLKPGDVVLFFDGDPIEDSDELLSRLRRLAAGYHVDLQIWRNGSARKLSAEVTERPDQRALVLRGDHEETGQGLAAKLGLQVRDITGRELAALGYAPDTPAVMIEAVDPESDAARQIAPGDLIHGVNREPVGSAAHFHELLAELPPGRNSVLVLSRQGRRFYALLRPGA